MFMTIKKWQILKLVLDRWFVFEYTNQCVTQVMDIAKYPEKYSSGRRGAPAKGIDRLRGARVQIPPSPLLMETFEKKVKISIDKAKTASYNNQAV